MSTTTDDDENPNSSIYLPNPSSLVQVLGGRLAHILHTLAKLLTLGLDSDLGRETLQSDLCWFLKENASHLVTKNYMNKLKLFIYVSKGNRPNPYDCDKRWIQ